MTPSRNTSTPANLTSSAMWTLHGVTDPRLRVSPLNIPASFVCRQPPIRGMAGLFTVCLPEQGGFGMKARHALAVAVCAAVFTASAQAAPPLKHTAWVKIAAAYTAQAKAHGAVASCTPWNGSGVVGMGCDFGDKGAIKLSWTSTPCVYSVLVQTPKPGLPANFRSSRTVDLKYCGAGWWTKPLPAPWS